MKLAREKRKYPFIILAFIHTSMVLFTFYKNKDRKKLFIVLSSYIGMAYIFDYFVLAFNGYTYKPGVFKNQMLNKYLGSLLSQGVYVPFTAIFITAFQLGWKVKIGFGLYFSLIETLFLRLKIYKHNWWRTIYTFLIIICSFKVNDIWYGKLKEKNRAIRFFSLFLMVQMVYQTTAFVSTVLKEKIYGLRNRKTLKEHFKVAPVIVFFQSFYIAWQIRKNTLVSKINIFGFLFLLDKYFIKKNVLSVKSVSILINNYFFIIIVSSLLQRLVYMGLEKENS